MEDIRFDVNKQKNKNRRNLINLFLFFKKHWIKFILLIIFILIIVFPNILGQLLGTWWNDFVTAFLSKITF